MMWRLAARIADWYLTQRDDDFIDQVQAMIDRDPRFTSVAIYRRGSEFQIVDMTDLDQAPTYQGDTR